ncbi:hypothetical protein ACFLTU_01140 [Bacteroidota bacterium]
MRGVSNCGPYGEYIPKNHPGGQLYNLDKDRGETNNIYLEHPDIVARLESEMKEIIENEHAEN